MINEMAMNTETYVIGKELDSFNADEVQNGIIAILDRGNNVVLDMSACHYISSTGLRVLLYTKKVADPKGLKVCLKGVGAEVQDVMNVTGFDSFFDYV